MRFTLYTDKTVSQAMSALNERLHGKSSRFDGWTDKKGEFSIGMTTPVIGKMNKQTYIKGKITREGGYTVIRGDVPNGADPRARILLSIALGIVGVIMIASGGLIGLVMLPAAVLLYFLMKGDYENSDALLNELQRTLKAKTTLPKPASVRKTTEIRPAVKSTAPKTANRTSAATGASSNATAKK